MKLILILLGLLLILLILRLFIVKEGFQNSSLKPKTIQEYNKFLNFYNPFCANWKKAIISSVASEIVQTPATDPSNPVAGNAPEISEIQMNEYITMLSNKLSQSLPPICKPLPSSINTINIVEVTKEIPNDVQSFINALNWMNSKLGNAHTNLGNALKGNSPIHQENFQDMCQNITSCLENNPQLVQQIIKETSKENDKNIERQQDILISAINPFLTNPDLIQASDNNISLVQKTQEIQEKAQSGELINQINVPGGRTIAKYQMPEGANNLNDIKQNNPGRYNELKQNYSQWVNLKGLLDNINANL